MNFSSTIYERGRQILQQGKIEITKQTPEEYNARAFGNDTYTLTAHLQKGKVIRMSCDCPYAQKGLNCKHEAALYQFILLNTKKEKTEKKKSIQAQKENKSPEQVIDDLYKSLKSIRNSKQKREQFILSINELFRDEMNQALKKYDRDIFKRWFSYVKAASDYFYENFWYQNNWLVIFEDSIKQLMNKNEQYRKQAIEVMAKYKREFSCRDLDQSVSNLVKRLSENEQIYYELYTLESAPKDEQEERLFEILLNANHKKSDIFFKYLEIFNQYKYYFSYVFIYVLSFPKEQAMILYEEYKKKKGKDYRLEAILYQDENSIKKLYSTLAFDMKNRPLEILLLRKLMNLYGEKWVEVCQNFYKQVEQKHNPKTINEIIYSVDDWQYAGIQLLDNKGNRYKRNYLELVEDKDVDLYKHVCLQEFIQKIKSDKKEYYYWFENIYRDFRYEHTNQDVLEALTYAKQYFSSQPEIVEKINEQLDRFI